MCWDNNVNDYIDMLIDKKIFDFVTHHFPFHVILQLLLINWLIIYSFVHRHKLSLHKSCKLHSVNSTSDD